MNEMKKRKSSTLPVRKVLFVCHGNVYRSFSAEALLKQYLDAHKIKGWEVFSAGTLAKKFPIDSEIIFDLKRLGVKDVRHKQHKLNKQMLRKFDLVIAMSQNQVDFIKNKFNYTHAVLFNELVKDEKSSVLDIEDKVKNYKNNRKGVEREIDSTIQYIHDSMPKLVEAINNRVYLFADFANGLRKHANGFPFIKLYETPNTLAFMSISIPSKEDGHILVIPKKRYIYFHELPPKILNELLLSIQKIGAIIDRDHGGYNVLLNNGRVAGQYIFHAHFHLLPRDSKDHIHLEGWGDKKMTVGQFVEFNKKLKEKIQKSKV